MTVRSILAAALALFLVASATPARADFAAGMTAYEAGDYTAAYREFLPLAEAGDAKAQFRVGRLFHVGNGRAIDGALAVAWYTKAHKQGYIPATFNLAHLYDVGDRIPRNYSVAVELYREAAEKNFTAAQLNLGLLIMAGHGVPVDYVEAYKWFYLAQEGNLPGAQGAIDYFSEYVSNEQRDSALIRKREWLKNHSRQ